MAEAVAEEHYGEHRERPFFGELVEFIVSGPVVQMAVEGEGAIVRPAHADRPDQPARRAPRAPSAATSRSRWART